MDGYHIRLFLWMVQTQLLNRRWDQLAFGIPQIHRHHRWFPVHPLDHHEFTCSIIQKIYVHVFFIILIFSFVLFLGKEYFEKHPSHVSDLCIHRNNWHTYHLLLNLLFSQSVPSELSLTSSCRFSFKGSNS